MPFSGDLGGDGRSRVKVSRTFSVFISSFEKWKASSRRLLRDNWGWNSNYLRLWCVCKRVGWETVQALHYCRRKGARTIQHTQFLIKKQDEFFSVVSCWFKILVRKNPFLLEAARQSVGVEGTFLACLEGKDGPWASKRLNKLWAIIFKCVLRRVFIKFPLSN